MDKIFISHSSKDKHIVDTFVEKILINGIGIDFRKIFFSSNNITGIGIGNDWRNTLKEALANANFFFVLISQNYKDSEVCQNEMGAIMFGPNSNIFPLLIEPLTLKEAGVLPEARQIVSLIDEDALDKLKDTLHDLLNLNDNKVSRWNQQKREFLVSCRQHIDSIKASNVINEKLTLGQQKELLTCFLEGYWRNDWFWDYDDSEIAKITHDGKYLIDGIYVFNITDLRYADGALSFRKVGVQVGDFRNYYNELNIHKNGILQGKEKVGDVKWNDTTLTRSLPNCMYGGDEIKVGDCIMSLNKRYKMYMQNDGNLVLYNEENKPIWSSSTNGAHIKKCLFREDGNLVLLSENNHVAWQSNSHARLARNLILQNDGNVVIYKIDGSAIWHSDTHERK